MKSPPAMNASNRNWLGRLARRQLAENPLQLWRLKRSAVRSLGLPCISAIADKSRRPPRRHGSSLTRAPAYSTRLPDQSRRRPASTKSERRSEQADRARPQSFVPGWQFIDFSLPLCRLFQSRGAEGEAGLDQRVDIARLGAVIDDGRADRELAVDRGGGRRGDAGFLQIDDDLGIEPVRIGAAVAEADDVELRPAPAAPARRRPAIAAFEIARQLAAARDRARRALGAMDLEGEPGLERAEAAREIGPEIARPGRPPAKPARLAPEIGRGRGEGARDAARRRAPG